jgi:hypothetical protein
MLGGADVPSPPLLADTNCQACVQTTQPSNPAERLRAHLRLARLRAPPRLLIAAPAGMGRLRRSERAGAGFD